MHILHCNPLGKSMFADFIRRIRAEGAQGRAGRTALVLPSPFLLEQARLELRQVDLPAWEFPRVLSLDELADSLSGLRKISRVEQELIVADIVRASTDERMHRCFGKVLDFSGFISALTRLFDEFKLAAVTPDELEGAWEAVRDELDRDTVRDEAIAGLFRTYYERLEACDVADLAGSYLLAVDALKTEEGKLPLDRIFMAEFSVLSPLRLRLIEALKRKVTVEIGICFEKDRSEIFSPVEPIYQALVGMGFRPVFHASDRDESPELFQIRRQLFSDRPIPTESAGRVSLVLSPDREREAAAAADKIKELLVTGECDPGDVAVVVRKMEDYPGLRRIFMERGIPVDLPDSVELVDAAISRLIFSWIDLVRAHGTRAAMMPVLKSPYIADRLGWQPDELEKTLLGEVVRVWPDWDAAIKRQAPDEEIAEVWLQGVHQLQQMAVLWLRPMSWNEWAQRLTALVEWLDVPGALRRRRTAGTLEFSRVRAELEAMQSLLDAAEQLAGCGGLLGEGEMTVTVGEFTDVLGRILKDRRISISGREESGVRVVMPGTASGMQFPVVLILGLMEGEFPALPRESWLYSDRDRRILAEAGIFLVTAAQREVAEDFQFAITAAMATERLILSAVADSETLPSRYMEEVTRLFDSDEVEVTRFGPHQVIAEKAEKAWGRRELLCGVLSRAGQQNFDTSDWRQIYDALKEEIPANLSDLVEVETDRKEKYSGRVSPELIRISRFSASALERYAACPFAFFVTDVLCLPEWAESEAGLDPLSNGSLWHEVLAVFLSRYRGQSLIPSEKDRYAREMGELLQEIVAVEERQGRIIPDVWWKFEYPRYRTAMIRWLDAEISTQQATATVPELLEWSFGLETWPGCDPASAEKPLRLGPVDQPVFLQGKIDRIDRAEAGCRVVDYKTGQVPKTKEIDLGLRLQVPVYMMAVESLLGRATATGEYQPVSRPLSSLVLPGKKVTKQELFAATESFVALYADRIRNGAFPPCPAAVCPDYCMARTFCRRAKAEPGTATEEQQDE